MKLVLIGIKEVNFEKDGTTKYKHLFLSSTNKCLVGWANYSLPKELLADTNSYSDERARAYEVEADEFNEKLRYKVKIPDDSTPIPF